MSWSFFVFLNNLTSYKKAWKKKIGYDERWNDKNKSISHHIQAILESSPTTPLKLKNNSKLKNQQQRNLKFCDHTPKPVE
jgi:flavin-dependent dehydrogenase